MKETTVPGTWEDPPRSTRQSYDWASLAETLREHPYRWRKVFDEDRSSLVVAIRTGSIRALDPSKGFQTRTSNNKRDAEPRTCTLFMRYVPENDEEWGSDLASSDG